MITVGNDLVRHQLHHQRKWYVFFGILLILFALGLFAALPFATLSVVIIFGSLMMLGGLLHLFAAFKFFEGSVRWLWVLFALFYFIAGYYAFHTPVTTAIVLTSLLAIFLIIAGGIRILNAVLLRAFQGWGWTLLSGFLTLLVGIMILTTPDAPFWVLGMFLAIDLLFQGINYLSLAAAINKIPPSSADV